MHFMLELQLESAYSFTEEIWLNSITPTSILFYKTHPIPKHKCFSSRLAVVFVKST